jgi:hypothetical protein
MPLPTSSLLGGSLLGLPSHGTGWVLRKPEKERLSLSLQTPPVPTVPSSSASLSSPGRTSESPSLNKAILPHSIHVLCLDFYTWSTKSQTTPVQVTIYLNHSVLPKLVAISFSLVNNILLSQQNKF